LDAWKRNPCVKLDNGNCRTGPARLSFPNIFQKGKVIEEGKEPKYGSSLLFPAGVDLSILRAEATAVALAKWPTAGQPGGPSLHSPFKDQKEKVGQYDGYQAGSIYLSCYAERKPPAVDTRLSPVVEESKIYPGVWAICTIRCFDFDKTVKKGVSFGLQSVMIIADDNEWGGGGSDPTKDYAGINIDQTVSPASLF
jgi:hypothetical protein